MSRTFILLLIGAGAIVAGGFVYQYSSPASDSFITMPVEKGSIAKTVKATGTINPVVSVNVGSYVSGVVKEVYCDYNMAVKKGQVCAKIDPRSYQTVVEQGRANLAISRANLRKDMAGLNYARASFERKQRLSRSQAVPMDALDSARSSYEQLEAQIELDEATIILQQAQLAAAEVNLSYTDIVSPIDGVVISRNVSEGETVAASFQTPKLFTIANDLREMRVHGKIDEADIGGLEVGQTARFTVDAYLDRSFSGKILDIRHAPETIQNVVTYTVVISANNPDQVLFPGMTANLSVITRDTGDVLKIPNAALRFRPKDAGYVVNLDPGQKTVWVVDSFGKAAPKSVKVGSSDEAGTQLLSGDLALGDKVIVGYSRPDAGNFRLAFGR